MAWNEPGKGQDPWKKGNGGNSQPPDIDEVVKNLQKQLKGLFGGGGGGSGTKRGPQGGFGFGMLMVVIIAVWLVGGFYKIDAAERGVVLRLGKHLKTTLPGLHWRPRGIDTFERVNVEKVNSHTFQKSMLTADENIVDLSMTVQYRNTDPEAYTFNVRDPETTLREVSESAIREVVGKRQLDFVLGEGRAEIAEQTRLLAQSTLDGYSTGIEVYIVNLLDAQPPGAVQGAFADAIRAREDRERLELQAEAYTNDVLPRARGAAQRVLAEADAYRSRVIADAEGETARFLKLLAEYEKEPQVTRQRLYLETMEDVYGKTNKVLLDAQGSGSLMYLPIDKLMEQQRRTGGANLTSEPTRRVEPSTARDDNRRGSARSRGDQ